MSVAEVEGPGELRVVSHRVSVLQQLKDVWQYRELLSGLVRKELKVKYKDSFLGFLWSLLNPALYVVVYYFAFQVAFRNNIPGFALFLICGLLVWNFFVGALPAATGSIVGNAAIVGKVSFPREILPLASVGAALVHFFLQSVVLFGTVLVFQRTPAWSYMPLIPLALLVLTILAGGLGIFLAAINVKYRDTQHFLELAMLGWFWATPIVYPYADFANNLLSHGVNPVIYRFNPITPIVLTFQRVFFNQLAPAGRDGKIVSVLPSPDAGIWWYCAQLLVVGGIAVLIFLWALRVFGRRQADFAEQL